MRAYITLKEKFSKKRFSPLGSVRAEAQLSNGAEYDITFLIYHGLIVISKKDATTVNTNKEGEKMTIIEEILDKYTSSVKSVFNFTISYNIERFKIVEYSGNIDTLEDIQKLQKMASKNDIIVEYVKSDYSKISSNPVFRALNDIYCEIAKNCDGALTMKDGCNPTGSLAINVGHQFKFGQISDIRHYTYIILFNFAVFKDCKVKYDKKTQMLNIELD